MTDTGPGSCRRATIRVSAEAAHKAGKKIMVDMIDVPDVEARAAEIDKLGVDYICVHTAFDVQSTGLNPLEELQKVNRVVKNARSAVAGGIKLATIEGIAAEKPAILIVGGGITGQADKRATALEMKKIMNQYA